MNNKYKLICLSHTKEPFCRDFEYGARKKIKTERDCRDAAYLSAGQVYDQWDEIYIEVRQRRCCTVWVVKTPNAPP